MPTRHSPGAPPTHAPALHVQLAATARAIEAVLEGRSLATVLETLPQPLRPGTQALAFHAMRRLGTAKAIVHHLVARTPKEPRVQALLLLGVALLETRLRLDSPAHDTPGGPPVYAVHTIVNQMVEATARDPRTQTARGLVNAVLRRLGREYPALADPLRDQPQARWNYPDWWISRMQAAWPDQWETVLAEGNRLPPLALRVNVRKNTREQLQAFLAREDVATRAVGDDALILETPRPITDIPGYRDGRWSVQDPSAQCAARLLPLQDGMRVLDACAAPGGKTAHLLERHDLVLTALDNQPQRLRRVQQNLERLDLLSPRVTLLAGDATRPAAWWDQQPYDAILADLPCSASGIVRRHPEIRWLRTPAQVRSAVALQARMLARLWPLLKPGGHLLYATCSLFPEEGEAQIRRFLAHEPQAHRRPAPGAILPGNPLDGDGFFYALIAKGD